MRIPGILYVQVIEESVPQMRMTFLTKLIVNALLAFAAYTIIYEPREARISTLKGTDTDGLLFRLEILAKETLGKLWAHLIALNRYYSRTVSSSRSNKEVIATLPIQNRR